MHKVIALVGPTGVGKTAVAIELAQKLEAQIVSCDSMQVYRDMAVLSQAPTHAQRRQAAHHLVECVDPTVSFDVGQYRKMALPLIHWILSQGKRVLIVGGTGLYLKALTQGLCDAPPSDAGVREQLWQECSGVGSVALHHRLKEVDALSASRIHSNDARRIVRALEVFAVSGKPLSAWWDGPQVQRIQEAVAMIGLTRSRQTLYERINQRLLHMIYEEGLINEARDILRRDLSPTARQVHGLADIERYLKGITTLQETIAIWQKRVRNYAKRQYTWFRHVPGITWVDIPAEESIWQTAHLVIEQLGSLAVHDAVLPQRSSLYPIA